MTGGSQDDCDLGNIGSGQADAQGVVRLIFSVKRYLDTAGGIEDCALGGMAEGCRVGMGLLTDYDQSGAARIFFDPAVEGITPPHLTVAPATGRS